VATADHKLLDHRITWAEVERTAVAKADCQHPHRSTIDYSHTRALKPKVSFLHATKNAGYALAANLKQTLQTCLPSAKHVAFQAQAHVRLLQPQ
jgi:hypothetical protein